MTVVSPSMPHAVALARRGFNDFKHLLPKPPDRRVCVSRTRRALMARRWTMFPLGHGITVRKTGCSCRAPLLYPTAHG